MRQASSDVHEFQGLKALMVQLLSARIDAAEAQLPAVDGDIAAHVALLRQTPLPSEMGLCRLAKALQLPDYEMLALALCVAAEEDPNIARMVARAQDPIGGSRPLIGLLATLLRQYGATPILLASGIAVQSGIAFLGDERAALPERSWIVPPHMAAALAAIISYPADVHPFAALPVAFHATAHTAIHGAVMSQTGQSETTLHPSAIVIRTASSREAAAAALMLAQRIDRHPVAMDMAAIAGHAGWLMACAAVPVVRISAGPAERIHLPSCHPYQGPIIVLTHPDVQMDMGMAHQDIILSVPDVAERAQVWIAQGVGEEPAQKAAHAYRQSAGRIAELAEYMAQQSHQQKDWSALAQAVQTSPSPLDGMARRLHARVSRADLVLPDAALADLDRLVARIGLRNGLADGLGPALVARYSPGVRALFTGESGTGKTLAAHWLSSQTGLPLYRVDQAALTSKWIGETEKNLAAILDAAQNADVMLFFDEADALFGARTDVSDANDRHANAQTNYLLQRIEDYEGVVILATNNRDRFDPAFVRRLDMIMAFPMPDPDARLRLWQVLLGTGHGLSHSEMVAMAMAIDLAGGHIRNIVLAAAVYAKGRDARILWPDIVAAAREEFAKLGRPAPAMQL
jgi:hypothetical protein